MIDSIFKKIKTDLSQFDSHAEMDNTQEPTTSAT